MKRTIGIALACLGVAAGCLGTGPTGEHQSAIVTTSDAQDLYSAEGCADLEGSGATIDRVAVEGDATLVAYVADGVVACVTDANALDLAEIDDGLAEFTTSTLPTSETDEEPATSPGPPSPGGDAEDPDPFPVRPTGTGPTSLY
jgi:hypothetical protein